MTTTTFPNATDIGIIVSCPGISENERNSLRLPGAAADDPSDDGGHEIGIPRRHMVLALTAHDLQLWSASRSFDPRFHTGSIPLGFITRVQLVRDDRPLFGRHDLRMTLGDGSRLFVSVPRSDGALAEELAQRLNN